MSRRFKPNQRHIKREFSRTAGGYHTHRKNLHYSNGSMRGGIRL